VSADGMAMTALSGFHEKFLAELWDGNRVKRCPTERNSMVDAILDDVQGGGGSAESSL